ncbi:LuxR C-terminal-related transcriptional regulator [Mycolicibacterium sp. HS_4_1]
MLRTWVQTESNDTVARHLQLAPSTIRTHLQRVHAKYAEVGRPASAKAELVARAVHGGFLTVDGL